MERSCICFIAQFAPYQPGLEQSQVRQEWQVTTCSLRACTTGKLEAEVEQNTNPDTAIWDAGTPNGNLITVPNTWPVTSEFCSELSTSQLRCLHSVLYYLGSIPTSTSWLHLSCNTSPERQGSGSQDCRLLPQLSASAPVSDLAAAGIWADGALCFSNWKLLRFK